MGQSVALGPEVVGPGRFSSSLVRWRSSCVRIGEYVSFESVDVDQASSHPRETGGRRGHASAWERGHWTDGSPVHHLHHGGVPPSVSGGPRLHDRRFGGRDLILADPLDSLQSRALTSQALEALECLRVEDPEFIPADRLDLSVQCRFQHLVGVFDLILGTSDVPNSLGTVAALSRLVQ